MKTKIQIKSTLGKVLFELETEENTMAKTVSEAVKSSTDLSSANLSSAKLSYADLRYADLRYADLRSTDLRYADLSYANLSYANLRYADLSYANLSYADLSSAKLDKSYIQIACIGSNKRMTTYCFDDDIVWCGCFKGRLDEFEAQVKKTHSKNEKHLREYLGFINYVRSLK
jgi:hypothetical protein